MSVEYSAHTMSYAMDLAQSVGRGPAMVNQRGPEGAINRAHSLLEVFDHMHRKTSRISPPLADGLMQQDILLQEEEQEMQEPHLKNIPAFILPRLYLLRASQGKNGVHAAEESLDSALEQTDPQNLLGLTAIFAEELAERGTDKIEIFKNLFHVRKLVELPYPSQPHYEHLLWNVYIHSPGLWDKFDSLSSMQKVKAGIADIHIAPQVPVVWNKQFQHFEINDTQKIITSMDRQAVEYMLFYEYPFRETYPDSCFGDQQYNTHVEMVDKLNQYIHEFIGTLT